MATTERLEARVSKEQKDVIRQAAALTGRSLTDFVVSTAYESAMKMIQEHQNWELNKQQGLAFVDALLQDSEPNERLKQAARRYKKVKFSV